MNIPIVKVVTKHFILIDTTHQPIAQNLICPGVYSVSSILIDQRNEAVHVDVSRRIYNASRCIVIDICRIATYPYCITIYAPLNCQPKDES